MKTDEYHSLENFMNGIIKKSGIYAILEFKEKASVGEGMTIDGMKDDAEAPDRMPSIIRIGTRANANMTKKDNLFEVIRAFCHELRHAHQAESNFECCDKEYQTELRLDRITADGLPVRYGVFSTSKTDQNGNVIQNKLHIQPWYPKNIREIDAELKGGIAGLYGILALYVPNPEEELLGYLNRNMKQDELERKRKIPYMLDFNRDLKSIDQIDKLYKQQMKQAIENPVPGYDITKDTISPAARLVRENHDFFAKVLQKLQYPYDGYDDRRQGAALSRYLYPGSAAKLTDNEKYEITFPAAIGLTGIPKISDELAKSAGIRPKQKRQNDYSVNPKQHTPKQNSKMEELARMLEREDAKREEHKTIIEHEY